MREENRGHPFTFDLPGTDRVTIGRTAGEGEAVGIKFKFFNFYASLGSRTQAVSKKLKR